MVLHEAVKQPVVRGIACTVAGVFFIAAIASGLFPDGVVSLDDEDPLVGPVELIHVVDRHRIPGVKAPPFRAFLDHFVRSGAADASVDITRASAASSPASARWGPGTPCGARAATRVGSEGTRPW